MRVPIGYDKQMLDLGLRRKIYWYLERASPHLLVAGQSGSGKTKALELIMSRCVRDLPECQLFLADPKRIDFGYAEGTPRFWSGEQSGEALETFRASMQARVDGVDVSNNWQILVFDELAAFTLLQADKKKKQELQDTLAAILLLGRGVRHAVVVAVQKALMEFFGTGGRSQFGTVMLLGSVDGDKEQVQMLMSQHKDEIAAESNSRGQFWVTMDGEGLRRGQVPWVTKTDEVREMILIGLSR